MKTAVNSLRRTGRPRGRKTVFRGIAVFCREHGYSQQHVREVLAGRRRSPRLRGLWSQWQATRLSANEE